MRRRCHWRHRDTRLLFFYTTFIRYTGYSRSFWERWQVFQFLSLSLSVSFFSICIPQINASQLQCLLTRAIFTFIALPDVRCNSEKYQQIYRNAQTQFISLKIYILLLGNRNLNLHLKIVPLNISRAIYLISRTVHINLIFLIKIKRATCDFNVSRHKRSENLINL